MGNCIAAVDLWEWLTGYFPDNPTMATYKLKVQGSSSQSVQESQCLCWSSLWAAQIRLGSLLFLLKVQTVKGRG